MTHTPAHTDCEINSETYRPTLLLRNVPDNIDTLKFIETTIHKAIDPIESTLKIVPNHGNALQLKSTIEFLTDLLTEVQAYRFFLETTK